MVTRKALIEEGIYHITQRAPGRELLFLEEGDYLRFLRLVKEVSGKFNLDIFCFALLSNHLHILLQIRKQNLDKAMKHLFQSYAQYFNMKYQRKGHVFCGVYRASLCDDDSYLFTASLYIHLNPYKAGLTQNIFEYRWFSLDPYVKNIKTSFLSTEVILGLLDGNDIFKARRIYKRALEGGGNLKYKNILEDKNAVNNFYDNFANWFSKHCSEANLEKIRGFSSYLELEKKIEEIRLATRFVKPQSRKALNYVVEQLRARGYSYHEISQKVEVGRNTIYRMEKEKIQN